MLSGFGFGSRGRQSALAGFDPATLSLTGWWRGSYTSGNWAGTASAGTSGSKTLTAANSPASGSALNGYTPVDLGGTNQHFTQANALASVSAYFMWALVYIDAIDTANTIPGSPYLNDHIIGDSSGNWGLALTTSGGTAVQAWHYSSGNKGVTLPISTGQWTLVQARFDGSTIRGKINSGSVQTIAAGNVSSLGTTYVGRSYGSTYVDGRIMDLGVMSTAGSDAQFDDIRSYVNNRYALSL